MTEDGEEKVEIETKNKSLDEIGDESEKKGKKKSDPEFHYHVYGSRWDRSSGFRGAMKIARACGAKIHFPDKEKSNTFQDFKSNLSKMGYDEVQEYVHLFYKISALQPVGVFEMRGVNVDVPNKFELSGYPEKALDELLEEEDSEKLKILSQLEVINKVKRANINLETYKVTKEKGSKIIEDYILSELQEKLREVVEDNRDSLPLIYSYLHEDTMSWHPIHQDLLNISSDLTHSIPKRAIEYDHMRSDSLIGSIIEKNTEKSLISIQSDEWYEEDNKLIVNLREFWDDMESANLAVNAPKIDTELQISPEGASNIRQVDRVWNNVKITESFQRSMPIKLAEKLYERISNELSNTDKKLRILMIINKYKDAPKKVKTRIKKENNDYNLSNEDLTEVEKIVNQLAKRDITSQWANSKDVPFAMIDYDKFLDFCEQYILGESQIET